MNQENILLSTSNLKKYYIGKKHIGKERPVVKALDGVDLSIERQKTLGVVGESGCGKSTLGRTILRLIEPTSGEITYDGKDLCKLDKNEMRMMRKKMQMIFQDPYASLNPRMNVREIIRAPLDAFDLYDKEERERRVLEVCDKVSIGRHLLRRYPHEFSGGQRQRIVIARALILEPEFIVCDEPVSALDVSVRSQVLNLMKDLQEEFKLTYLFISHDLSVVKHISDTIAVMYLGNIVEIAGKHELFEKPTHPYTQALLSAIPVPDVDYKSERIVLEGDVPSPLHSPPGCKFHTRCRYAKEECSVDAPQLKDIGGGHMVACHLCQGAQTLTDSI